MTIQLHAGLPLSSLEGNEGGHGGGIGGVNGGARQAASERAAAGNLFAGSIT
jgi:hypothetical protein